MISIHICLVSLIVQYISLSVIDIYGKVLPLVFHQRSYFRRQTPRAEMLQKRRCISFVWKAWRNGQASRRTTNGQNKCIMFPDFSISSYFIVFSFVWSLSQLHRYNIRQYCPSSSIAERFPRTLLESTASAISSSGGFLWELRLFFEVNWVVYDYYVEYSSIRLEYSCWIKHMTD